MRQLYFILIVIFYAFQSAAQQAKCTLQPPQVKINFGTGNGGEQNSLVSTRYDRVSHYCPSDGYFAITPYTSNCFRDDWFTLSEDHTPGDANGNMLLVNSSPRSGMFLNTTITGLKGGTLYEFGVWMMNVCKITEKCPFPLLPEITIRLQTTDGRNVAQLETGEVSRQQSPRWTQYRFMFTTPAVADNLMLIMVNHAPGGCGNDFALDDITFRECVVIPPPVVKTTAKTTPSSKKKAITKKTATAPSQKPVTKPAGSAVAKSASKPVAKTAVKPAVKPPAKPAVKPAAKTTVKATKPSAKPVAKPVAKSPSKPSVKPLVKKEQILETAKTKTDTAKVSAPVVKQRRLSLPPPPPVLRTRTNAVVKQIEMEAGDIKIDLYDNGEIDGDTVSIYHNNRLLASRAKLSQKAVSFRISVNEAQPHHELVMVADNLGSIPPNTSLMIVRAGDQRHEVFISSTKQKNAKVVFDLKE